MKASLTTARIGFIICAILWLPIGIIVASLLRGFSIPPVDALLTLWPTLPSGLPLAVATYLIRREGYRTTAWVSAAVLGIISIYAAILGGLFGPLGIVIFAMVICLPSWVIFGVIRFLKFRQR